MMKMEAAFSDMFKKESTRLAGQQPLTTRVTRKVSRFSRKNKITEQAIHLKQIIPEFSSFDMNSFFETVREGNIKMLAYLLDKSKNVCALVNMFDKDGVYAPIHCVARYNQVEAASWLLKNGAKIGLIGKDDITALHVASSYNCVDMVRLLIREGADVNAPTSYGSTALSLACRRSYHEVVKVLVVQDYININIKDYNDNSAIHVACAYGKAQVVQLLLEHGADLRLVNADQRTPLHCAVYLGGSTKMIKLILDKAEARKMDLPAFINAPDSQGNTSLHLSAQNGFIKACRFLLDKQTRIDPVNDEMQTPLHLACMGGHVSVVEMLIGKGALVNVVDCMKRSPMHRAAINGSMDTLEALVMNRGHKNCQDKNGMSPLLCAVVSGQINAARFLLASGADIKVCNNKAKSCLHFALESMDYDALNMLLETGAQELINRGDENDAAPIHYAAGLATSEGLQILLKYDCRLNLKDKLDRSPLHIATELNRLQCVQLLCQVAPAQMNHVDDSGRTPLHYAAIKGNRKVCQTLLKAGSHLSSKDDLRLTPVHLAALYGCNKCLRCMIEYEPNLECPDKSGNTPLHLAADKSQVETIRILLDAGADVMTRNNDSNTCLDIAIDANDVEVSMEIIKHTRGKEALYHRGYDGHKPLKRIIERLPDVAAYVMDICMTRSNISKYHHDYSVTYDFQLLDPGPDDESFLSGERFFAPLTMVRCKREELLCHPLCRKLLDYKWRSLGRPMHYLNFFTYLVFLITFSAFVLLLRSEALMWSSFNPVDHLATNFSQLPLVCQNKYRQLFAGNETGFDHDLHTEATHYEVFQKGYALVLCAFVSFQIMKELFQMFSRRLKYFKELSNWIEFLLYSNCATFAMPIFVPQLGKCELLVWNFYWIFGIISLFLAWINLCLYLRKSGQVGIYVVMIQDVFMTLLRVMLMFTVVLIAFGLVFYLLLKEQASFRSLELTMLKVMVMTIGEMDYTDVFINSETEVNPDNGAPKLPLSWLAQTFFLVFCFVMPIIFMNLLIGLAVGDIDTIQKTAHLEKRKMQVDFVADIEDKYPKIVIRQFYKSKLVHYPNKVKTNRFSKLFSAKELTFKGHENEDQEYAQKYKETRLELKLEKDLRKQKQKMKAIQESLKDLQHHARLMVEAFEMKMDNKKEKPQTVSEQELQEIHSRSERSRNAKDQ